MGGCGGGEEEGEGGRERRMEAGRETGERAHTLRIILLQIIQLRNGCRTRRRHIKIILEHSMQHVGEQEDVVRQGNPIFFGSVCGGRSFHAALGASFTHRSEQVPFFIVPIKWNCRTLTRSDHKAAASARRVPTNQWRPACPSTRAAIIRSRL